MRVPRATRVLARARTVPCDVDLPFPELADEEIWAPEPPEPSSPMTAAITRPGSETKGLQDLEIARKFTKNR